MTRIGVLALQGDFVEHCKVLERIGAACVQVRLPAHLTGLDGLIIPGGESTTIGKLAEDFGLIQPLQRFGSERAIWGTCAGAIFLSRDARRQQPLLGLMDITVERNAFGRQVNSFETDLQVPVLVEAGLDGRPFHAVFIPRSVDQFSQGECKNPGGVGGWTHCCSPAGPPFSDIFSPRTDR